MLQGLLFSAESNTKGMIITLLKTDHSIKNLDDGGFSTISCLLGNLEFRKQEWCLENIRANWHDGELLYWDRLRNDELSFGLCPDGGRGSHDSRASDSATGGAWFHREST